MTSAGDVSKGPYIFCRTGPHLDDKSMLELGVEHSAFVECDKDRPKRYMRYVRRELHSTVQNTQRYQVHPGDASPRKDS